MSHPDLSVRAVSASLLNYLETLTPQAISIGISLGDVLILEERNSLNEYREDIDNINKLLEKCSWIVITLLESVDQTKKIRTLLMEKRQEALAKSAQIISANPKTIHLPDEILGIIARYVQKEPISAQDAAKLMSSSCRWDKILLANCLIQLYDHGSQSFSYAESLPSLLGASSQVNLVVELNKVTYSTLYQWDQPLLQSRGRWITLTSIGDRVSYAIRKGLFDLRCPNCPPVATTIKPHRPAVLVQF